MSAAALWVALHQVPGFGPAVADGVRSVVGPGPVAWAEDVAYGAADRVNLLVRGDSQPKTYWDEPLPPASRPPGPSAALPGAEDAAEATPSEPAFEPPPFTPPFDGVAAPGDGRWIPMIAPGDDGRTAMWKSLVHPDPKRPFAAVAVVALDLEALDLHLVAGTEEPKSYRVHEADRTGVLPLHHRSVVAAAFNGGFKATHGNYGMMLGGQEFLPPRDIACTLALFADSHVEIRTFSELKERTHLMAYYRQTPPCLIERGDENPGLLMEFNRNWGATVSGETIIRRSAIGLDQTGRILYYGLGDAVTAQSIGRAMKAIGSFDAAQLDVNYSYPRFVLFDTTGTDPVLTAPLIPDLKFEPTDYTVSPSERDFFYLTRRI
jgi:hypothetical protein